ncbi:anti-sigma factor, partial [Kibdelosporangium lantanae]
IAAAGVAAAVSFGITWYNQASRLDDEIAQNQSQLDRINTILGAPDAQTVHGTGGTLTVVMSHSANGMVITAHNLQAPTPAESLQAWSVTTNRQKIPLGLLNSSSGTILVPDLAQAADISYVAITLEPRGGATTPSSHVVATANVT